MLSRRKFIHLTASASILSGVAPNLNLFAAEQDREYQGDLFVMVQALGGWDVTSFCDPKLNVPNEAEINHWARTGDIETAGNIRYAPFADNKNFFEKYYKHMLVVNGIDSQTNSHDAGKTHNFSGRLANGYPTPTALAASVYASDLPMAYVTQGGYNETARLIRANRINNSRSLSNIINPNLYNDTTTHLPDGDWQRIQNYHAQRNARLNSQTNLTPRQGYNRQLFNSAVANSGKLAKLSDSLKLTQQDSYESGQLGNFKKTTDITLAGFLSGVTASADLTIGQFDTHDNHDEEHAVALTNLTQAIDYLWQQAEVFGLADRLKVMVASDFGRKPFYNDDNGKDHWPISSALFMQKNATWGNRVVGVTDEGHNALAVNPVTLERDDSSGVIIYPKDILTSTRQFFNVASHDFAAPFPLRAENNIDIFNNQLQTAQLSDPRNLIRRV